MTHAGSDQVCLQPRSRPSVIYRTMRHSESLPRQMLLLYELKHLLVIHPEKRLYIALESQPDRRYAFKVTRASLSSSFTSPRSSHGGSVVCVLQLCLGEVKGHCCKTNELLEHLDRAAPALRLDDGVVVFSGDASMTGHYGIGSFTADRLAVTFRLQSLA